MARPPRQVMAFDYGLRNIGVAVGQTLTGTSSPLPPLRARDGVPNWDEVAKLIREWEPDALIVGIPLNMDGSDSEMSVRARKFGNRLNGRFQKPWIAVDERLSSREAKERARELGHRGDYNERPVDGLAAQLILTSWLETHQGDSTT
ncbi:Holliday junction resolvase RuvX [Aestuariirhabdus litorea]|uniref:Putative pre-16S rRNA nuclease n=1 Tax=Aestuariirhabdus litorea TaxID=2528527 RepID=A0A3P3VIZ2_9GAMM|nr:Holliday junction resolvase RuvX [Aestuariirhabdus litorea]RRJ82711.1 Holliday junction resolvase RuvX [Aestuariirhabdus litorea]RWW92871.1 Holliday junction resolvase RuvX [Endozoicomonadaceae bacterium GTF-13]